MYHYKSTIRPCIEYCFHAWAGAPGCRLEMLDEIQKRIYRSVGSSLAASLIPLAHCQNVIRFFIVITLVDLHLNWVNWFHYLFLESGLLVIQIDCMILLSPFLDVLRIFRSTVFFPCIATFWSFPLTDDLSGFKSRINRLLSVGSF